MPKRVGDDGELRGGLPPPPPVDEPRLTVLPAGEPAAGSCGASTQLLASSSWRLSRSQSPASGSEAAFSAAAVACTSILGRLPSSGSAPHPTGAAAAAVAAPLCASGIPCTLDPGWCCCCGDGGSGGSGVPARSHVGDVPMRTAELPTGDAAASGPSSGAGGTI
eukprot:304925-Chlamydomonas_euryale.AAC.2